VDPTGHFVYVTDFESIIGSNVAGFSINRNTGALTSVPGSPFPTLGMPSSVAVDPSGEFVYVVSDSDDAVVAYSIDKKFGVLTPVPGSPFATGRIPFSVAITR
jgi:6-phosphogluconolactonase